MVDASNAFNSLNPKVVLHNVHKVCPSLSMVLQNTYGAGTDLYVGGQVLHSKEGTTQGDPLAMPMFAVASLPMIDHLQKASPTARQSWYADDASNGDKLKALKFGGTC